MPRIKIIGLGNEYRNDDGVGIAAIRRLRGRLPSHVTLLELGGDGTTLLEAWQGTSTVIVIDAVQSGDKPGTIHRLDASERDLPASLFGVSTHAFSLAAAVALARTLKELPEKVLVYGIEGQDFTTGTILTQAVDKALDRLLAELVNELNNDKEQPANA